MTLSGAPILTDENIHEEVVAFLRGEGHDVLDVKESGLMGTDDLPLIRLSLAEQRIILTHDSDFGRLAVHNHEPLVGIIYLRPGHILPEFTVGTLRAVLAQLLDPQPPFIIVARRTGNSVRIRVRQL